MNMYQQDSDFVHWFLGYDPYFHSGYLADMRQHESGDVYQGHYFRNYNDVECSQIENDEIIARALQDEFSQLEINEPSDFTHAGESQLHVSHDPQNWYNSSSPRNYYSGYAYGPDDPDNLVPNSSSSSPSDSEECSCSLEVTDGYLLDHEVGKRLNQMIPIPHVPRINGEIPSIDEATSDHERLLHRLQLYNFVEHKVQGDGNCQFRALSDQLYCTSDNHKYVRQEVVNQLKSHPETYEGYVPMDYADYLRKMSKSGEWGDHVTLQAAADSYGVRIVVITSFKDTCYIEILPNFQKSKRDIYLSFWAEVHYNSIYPERDIPSSEIRKKKKWWIFGN